MKVEPNIALITGATSGFGSVVASHLINKGYTVIALGRSKAKLNSLVLDLKKAKPNCSVKQIICDLSSFKSIVKACETVKLEFDRINLLIMNAGVWNFQFIETEDEIEETLQVNLLSPVLIFQRLRHLIPTDGNSKVMFTSSGLHQGTLNFNDLEFRDKFSGYKSYRQSKLAIILITRLFAKQSEYSGISFYAVHPGLVNTKLVRNAGWFSKLFFRVFGKSTEKGAQTHRCLIDQPAETLTSGEYYSNCEITKTTQESYDLHMAEKLLNVINEYFGDHLKSEPNV